MSLFLHQTTTSAALKRASSELYMSLFLHQTTTLPLFLVTHITLYMSLFLHQTTTCESSFSFIFCCICLYSYIKPQRKMGLVVLRGSCICLYSYIKPQHVRGRRENHHVVYVSIPTSNHNRGCPIRKPSLLYMSLFLHQTTTLIVCLYI